MTKKFVKVPEDRFERIMFSANLAGTLSGIKITHDEIMEAVNKENIILTEEQQKELEKEFPL